MKRRIISFITLTIVMNSITLNAYYYLNTPYKTQEFNISQLGTPLCKSLSSYNESDIPTIFVPGILASWYSEEGLEEAKVKRWIPDPITYAYDCWGR